MEFFVKSLFLGAVQGILEWLPVSSEGILTILQINFLGRDFAEAISFSLWLHLGTWLAVVLYFWKDLKKIIREVPNFFKKTPESDNRKILLFLIVTAIATGIVGLPILLLAIESEVSGNLATIIIGVFLILTAFFQKFAPRFSQKQVKNLTVWDAVFVGGIQGLSVLPGFSRSGLTIVTLLARKFVLPDALRLSFLASILPVLGGEIILGFLGKFRFDPIFALGGVSASFVFGFLTIGVLMRAAQKFPFWIVTLVLGLLTLLLALVI